VDSLVAFVDSSRMASSSSSSSFLRPDISASIDCLGSRATTDFAFGDASGLAPSPSSSFLRADIAASIDARGSNGAVSVDSLVAFVDSSRMASSSSSSSFLRPDISASIDCLGSRATTDFAFGDASGLAPSPSSSFLRADIAASIEALGSSVTARLAFRTFFNFTSSSCPSPFLL